MKCKSDIISSERDESAVFCSVRVECDADNSIAGQEQILLSFPTPFQSIKWSIQTSDLQQSNILSANGENILSGTKDDPTELNFAVMRHKVTNNMTVPSKRNFSLQLGFKGSRIQQSEDGPPSSNHYVGFALSISENVFSVDVFPRRNVQEMLAAILTYFLSIM